VINKVCFFVGSWSKQSHLINLFKTDLAQHVNASLEVMARDAKLMRGDGPTVFCSVKEGKGVDDVAEKILCAWRAAGRPGEPGPVGDVFQ
jgi:urease accessory protein